MRFDRYWWRGLQILGPVVVICWMWGVIPKPTTFEHTQAWTEAQTKRAAYQYDDRTDAGVAAVQALAASMERMVDAESTKIRSIADPLERLTAMSAAEVRLERMMSKHPMYPGVIAPWLQESLRQAAGVSGGPWNDPEMIRVAQNHTELLGAALNEQEKIMQQYGFGVTEPISLTAPYYFSWILRWVLLLTFSGLAGTLVLGLKLSHFGYNWKLVAEREFGSIAVGIAVAPFANIMMLEAYEERNRYRDCIAVASSEIGIGDALRFSFGFRTAMVATIAGLLTNLFGGAHVAMAADNQPVTVQTTTYVELEDPDAPVDNELRLVVPMDNGTAAQFDYNLNGDMFDLGVRGRTRTFLGNTKIQPRALAVFSKDRFALKLQAVTLGKGWSLFSSFKLPESARASMYHELAVDTGTIGPAQVQAVIIESNSFGNQAKWQAGPLFNIPVGKGTLSVLGAFGLGGGGPGDQLRVQYTVSF